MLCSEHLIWGCFVDEYSRDSYIIFILQGTVEATGTFYELQESGLDFARQLDLDVEEEDKELKKGSVDHSISCRSYNKVKRQDSETSQIVSF
jgi:hypothetical protein